MLSTKFTAPQHVQGHEESEAATPLDPEQEEEARSLDLVQRMVVSALAVVVGGAISAGIAASIASNPADLDRASVIGLWVFVGIAGLLTAATVLVINRRHPWVGRQACDITSAAGAFSARSRAARRSAASRYAASAMSGSMGALGTRTCGLCASM
jgi:hypothetical protein